MEKTKINEKEAGIGPFKKIIRNSANTVTLRTDKERHEAKEERGFRNKKLESLRKHWQTKLNNKQAGNLGTFIQDMKYNIAIKVQIVVRI